MQFPLRSSRSVQGLYTRLPDREGRDVFPPEVTFNSEYVQRSYQALNQDYQIGVERNRKKSNVSAESKS